MSEPPDVDRPFLTVFVPAYNEERGLERNVLLLLAKLEAPGLDFELLIVDDGSRDQTPRIADRLGSTFARVRVVHHPTNRGIGGGLKTAIAHARGEWLILVPADLAIDLEQIPRYVEASADADLVVGISSDRIDYSLFRRIVSWTNIRLIQLLYGMPQRQFNYISLYRLELLRRISVDYPHSAFFFAEIMIKVDRLGGRLVEVEVDYRPRESGRASGAGWRLLARTARDMLHFRARQLREDLADFVQRRP